MFYWNERSGNSRRAICKLLFLLIAALPLLGDAAPAFGDASARAVITPAAGTVEEVFSLTLSLEGTDIQNFGEPIVGESNQFTIRRVGEGERQISINGKVSISKSYSYEILLSSRLKPGKYTLPPIYFEVGGKRYDVNTEQFEVLPSREPQKSAEATELEEGSVDQASVDVTQSVDNSEPFVGQQILYTAQVTASLQMQSATVSDQDFNGFWHEPLGKPVSSARQINMLTINSMLIKEALYPNTVGELEIPERSLKAEVIQRVPGGRKRQQRGLFGVIIETDEIRKLNKQFDSEPVSLKVKPLPPPPPGIETVYTPVGKVKLNAFVDKFDVEFGESINYTIELSGDANLRPVLLPPAEGPDKDKFKIYPSDPEISAQFSGNRMFHKRKFSLALVPKTAGRFEAPTYRFLVFDPEKQKYEILQSPKRIIEVKPGQAGSSAISPGNPTGGPEDVKQLGEDLMPQRLGKKLLSPPQPLGRGTLLFGFILYPLIIIALRVYLHQQQLAAADPIAFRSRKALGELQQQLSVIERRGDDPACAALSAAYKNYLGAKLAKEGAALTAGDAYEGLKTAIADKELAESAAQLLRQFERLQYGGGSEDPSKLLTKVKEMAETLEKAWEQKS